MKHLYLRLHAVAAVVLLAAGAHGQEPIKFARTPDISPDGKLVAFSYLGDVWVVETIGGVARPITMHTAHDYMPVFSPDGRSIAFSSNRHGSYDVFVAPVQGGRPRRLTSDSAADYACGWSPDGKNVLFVSSRSTDYPPEFELYSVAADGGQARRITHAGARDGVYSPKGDQIAYVHGPGTWYRKGYRGSSNDDIWICNSDGTNHRQLTQFPGQDTSPMWSPDGKFVYYVSEYYGTPANIVKQDFAGRTQPQLMTFHKEDAVRRARISGNGEWIVYECGPDLWVASTREGTPPRKLAIEIHADDKTNRESIQTFTQGATEFALSPDEKHVAFVVHGVIFLMARDSTSGPKTATRLTDGPGYDHNIAWSHDGKKIVFCSDRDGHEDIYSLEQNDPEHSKLVEAKKFKVTQLTRTIEAETAVAFSPDGKRISFLRSGKLWTMNPDATDQKPIVNDVQVVDYEWSPDSKWIAYSRLDGSFASEVYIIPATGGEAKNVTRYATRNDSITWAGNGKKIAYISQRRRFQTVYVTSLQKPATPNAPLTSDIDWDDIHLRVEQPVQMDVDHAVISPDGSRVAFRAGSNGGDLFVANTNGSQLTRLTSGNARPEWIVWAKKQSDTIYFLDGTGQIRTARVGGTSSLSAFGLISEPTTLAFRVKMTVRVDEEFQEIFDQSWRALDEHFYDPKYHGADWTAVRAKYRPLVKHIALREDLDALVSLMMGELNASHLGIMRQGTRPEEVTADLGVIFDESYRGPGLKVAEILKHGPADKRGINLKAGDVVLAIDGTDVSDKVEISTLLNDKVNQSVTLQVTLNPADAKATKRKVEIQATTRDQVNKLMYDRWVATNAKRVGELSHGKLGYIHIPSMDEAGLDRFVRALYSDNYDKDAIVLDVRYNGGGFTHDQVLNYLGAKEHTMFRQRDGGEGLVLRNYDRKWTKPAALLINNRSYSDAEIFPNAFRTLGLGKLVGQTTGAHVIGTSAVPLIDGSWFYVPRTGVYTMKGVNMEKEGVAPDVPVDQHPDQLAKGHDAQLEKAVEVLQQDVVAWKKAHTPVAVKAGDGKAAAAVATPVPLAK